MRVVSCVEVEVEVEEVEAGKEDRKKKPWEVWGLDILSFGGWGMDRLRLALTD